ncbi:hypothetical protein KKE06_04300 [Candidatus Micrarchaeota archaeon]|nr:hypothetical protein [Candidatus Micrarchaeota archaeon]MBU1930322.1 hypothetical protein [Candidatus Micrarchaeota archaeon]
MAISLSSVGIPLQSSKDAIIHVLSEQWPLTAKQLFSVLKRSYGFTVTYQALHKTLSQLVKQGVLQKIGSLYKLDKEWVARIKSFGEKVAHEYSKTSFKDFSEDIITLSVDNFLSAVKFIINEFYTTFPNPGKKSALCLWEHTCCWVGFGEEEYTNLKKMFASCTHCALCKNKTVLDQYFSDFLEKQGKHCFCGVDYNATGDIFVQGDFVAQVYYPASFRKELYRVFQKTKKVEEFDPDAFFRIISKSNKISIVITKNPSFAEHLRQNLFLLKKGN